MDLATASYDPPSEHLREPYRRLSGCLAELRQELAAAQEQQAATQAQLTAAQEQQAATQAQLAAALAELAAAQERLATALAEIERLQQGGKGGAAPFSKGERKQNPKKPGRKRGQGKFTNRAAPDYAECDVSDETAAVDAPVCPECGGKLGLPEYEEASTIGIPEMPRPQVTRFRVEKRVCTCCKHLERGTHPDLKPDQFGATAHRVDDRVYSLAHWLHYGLGLPVRKVPEVLVRWFRVPLTQSAITQDALRRVGNTLPEPPETKPDPVPDPAPVAVPANMPVAPTPLEPAPVGAVGQVYLELRRRMRAEPQVHTDDTSWRIGGGTAWLMVFCSMRLVVYQIRKQHRNDEVREILGDLFAGILICDRGPSYDALNLRRVLQQKCLPHLIRNITEVLPLLTGEARTAAEGLRALLREALALWHAYHDGQTEDFATKAKELCGRAEVALAPETHVNPILDRLVQGIGRQHDRGHVFRFLEDPTIPPTNNYGERTLRPPIIQRKISQCSRTEGGAEAQAAWSSVIGTLRALKSEDLLADLLACMRTGKLPGLEPPAALLSGSPAAP